MMGYATRIKPIVIVLMIGSHQYNTDYVPRKPFVDWIVKQTERPQETVLTRGANVIRDFANGIANALPRLMKMLHVLLNKTIKKMLRHLMPTERTGRRGPVI